jgi:hypothetical protein
MGREGILAVPPKLAAAFAALFALTNISLSYNVEITVQTNCRAQFIVPLRSPERLKRELQLISVECNFQRFHCTSLAASASLLSSVTAFD